MNSYKKIIGIMALLLAGLALYFFGLRAPAGPTDSAKSQVGSTRPPHTMRTASAAAAGAHSGAAAVASAADPIEAQCQQVQATLAGASDANAREAALAGARARAREQVAQLIKQAGNSPNLTEQAIGHLFHAQTMAQQTAQDRERETPNCSHIFACAQKIREAMAQVFAKDSNEIAKLAISSPDPALYAIAFHACNYMDVQAPGFCQQISARQWAQRDPDNGIAWLYVAKQSNETARGKASGELENALLHLLQAKTFDPRLASLLQFGNDSASSTTPVFTRLELATLIDGLGDLVSLPPLFPVLDYCKPAQLQDVNRRQTCDAVANKLAGDQSNASSAEVAREIGEKLGWPAQRLQPLREQHDAFMGLVLGLGKAAPASMAAGNALAQSVAQCKADLTSLGLIERNIRDGEIVTMRQRLAQSGVSQAEMAARYRANEKKFEHPPASAGQ
jgi:hypothetical protein